MMHFNWNQILKEWGIPIIIIGLAFMFLPSMMSAWLAPSLGALLGQTFGYAVSFIIAAMSLWFSNYVRKHA